MSSRLFFQTRNLDDLNLSYGDIIIVNINQKKTFSKLTLNLINRFDQTTYVNESHPNEHFTCFILIFFASKHGTKLNLHIHSRVTVVFVILFYVCKSNLYRLSIWDRKTIGKKCRFYDSNHSNGQQICTAANKIVFGYFQVE